MNIENELTPFELPNEPGRTFFENAGSSRRDGLELSYTRQLLKQLKFSLAYTYSDFAFKRFIDTNGGVFDGNRIPAIPQKLFYIDFIWLANSGVYAAWDTTYTGSLYADNANQTQVKSSTVSNIRFGYNGFYDAWELASFMGISNLFNEKYNNNIRINAFGSRYFEPAPERNLYIGVTLRRNFSD